LLFGKLTEALKHAGGFHMPATVGATSGVETGTGGGRTAVMIPVMSQVRLTLTEKFSESELSL